MIRYLRFNDCYLKPLSRFKAHADWLDQVGSGRHKALIIGAPLDVPAARAGRLIVDASIIKPTVLTFTRVDKTAASLIEIKTSAMELLEQIKIERTLQGTFLGMAFIQADLQSGLFHPRLNPSNLTEISDNLFRGRLVVAAPAEAVRLGSELFTRCLARGLKGLTTTF